MRRNIIQSFWMGPIGTMERLCMKSYLAHGHEFHLYVYPSFSDADKVPQGVVLKDANEIVPMQRVREFRWVQQSSDFFRVALLMKRGNWWVDLDSVCLKPFDFEEDYVFCDTPTARLCQNNPIAVPGPDTPIMTAWYHWIATMAFQQKQKCSFQKIGPDQLGRLVKHFNLQKYVQPLHIFDPVGWERVSSVIDPNVSFDISNSYAVHFFHAAWGNGPQAKAHKISPDPEGKYPDECLYEMMKARYGV